MNFSIESLHIRSFEPADVYRVLEIRNSNLLNMVDEDNYPNEVIHEMINRVTAERIISIAEQDNYHITIAEVDWNGTPIIVGCGGLCENKIKEAALKLLFVDRDYQARGIGTKLLNSLEELAKEKTITKLTVEASVLASEYFYPKNGYSIDSEETGSMGKVILMSKELEYQVKVSWLVTALKK